MLVAEHQILYVSVDQRVYIMLHYRGQVRKVSMDCIYKMTSERYHLIPTYSTIST